MQNVLVIDDNPDDLEIFQRLLRKSSTRFGVHTLNSGEAGVRLLGREAIDAVLLDYRIPGEDCMITISAIKARHSEMPVIVVTGQGSEEVAVAALRAGAADYVIKSDLTPLSLEQRIKISIQQARLRREFNEVSHLSQAVLATATSGILGISQDRRILQLNRAARGILKIRDEGVPFDWPADLMFLDAEDYTPLPGHADPVTRCLDGETLDAEVHPIGWQDMPDTRYLRLSGSPIEERSSPLRAVLVFDDITVSERNRQKIERAGRLDALGQLTGGIAHDFNNILASQRYAIEFAIEHFGRDKSLDYLERALANIDRGVSLGNRLLAFAKGQPVKLTSHNVGSLIDAVRELIGLSLDPAIALDISIEDPSMLVVCDRGQFENALVNIVFNARDAIVKARRSGIVPRGGKWRIDLAIRSISTGYPSIPRDHVDERSMSSAHLSSRLHDPDDNFGQNLPPFVEISITDNGIGMSREEVGRALDPFFTTKKKEGGVGLGLSMVYGFVEQSAGELRLYSERNRGTTIRLLLPRGSQAAAAVQRDQLRRAPPGTGETILIADDDPELLLLLQEVLSGLGYRSLAYSGSADLLEDVAKGVPFDALLTDIIMPNDMDGFALAAEIRAHRPTVPVIYMSGYPNVSRDEMGEIVGPVLLKPCAPLELGLTLKDVLTAASENPN